MRDIPFQRLIYHASAGFAHRRMTHRSLGVGGYGFWGPRACPWGSIRKGGGCVSIYFFCNCEVYSIFHPHRSYVDGNEVGFISKFFLKKMEE